MTTKSCLYLDLYSNSTSLLTLNYSLTALSTMVRRFTRGVARNLLQRSISEQGQVEHHDQQIERLVSDLVEARRAKSNADYRIKHLIVRLTMPSPVSQAMKNRIGAEIQDAIEKKMVLKTQILTLRAKCNIRISSRSNVVQNLTEDLSKLRRCMVVPFTKMSQMVRNT